LETAVKSFIEGEFEVNYNYDTKPITGERVRRV